MLLVKLHVGRLVEADVKAECERMGPVQKVGCLSPPGLGPQILFYFQDCLHTREHAAWQSLG